MQRPVAFPNALTAGQAYASTACWHAAAGPIADGVGGTRFPAQFVDGDRNRAVSGRRPTPAALSRSNDNY